MNNTGQPPSRLVRIVIAAIVLSVLSLVQSDAAPVNRAKPNIVLFLADDLGYGELGCQGNPEIPTPNIDSLARDGIRFTDAYVGSPYCSPSRAGLLTGRYQTRFGHELNFVGKQNLSESIGLPASETTMATWLRQAGHATGLIGKWHLGGAPAFHPQSRGFQDFYGFLHEGHFFVPPPYPGVLSFLRTNSLPDAFEGQHRVNDIIWSTHLPYSEPPYDADNPLLRGHDPIVENEYLTDALTREALRFVDAHRTEPFFLYLAYNAVHSPMQATKGSVDRHDHITDLQRRIFAGMLSSLDESVGALLRRLDELDLADNTLVVFLSDNGGPTVELTSRNHPLRGGKGQLWEGGIRIPFLVRWKTHLPAGEVYTHPVIALDILPTVLAAIGAPPPEDIELDGVNLLPYLKEQTGIPPHASLFWRYGSNVAYRQGPWKLVRQRARGGAAVDPGFQLFNLEQDISETEDLSAEDPEMFQELVSDLEAMDEQMVEPLWGRRR